MPAPHNALKAALAAKTVQMGLWMNLVSPIAAEALARGGCHGPRGGHGCVRNGCGYPAQTNGAGYA